MAFVSGQGDGIIADGGIAGGGQVRSGAVRGALERLPPEQREVLALAFFGHCTQAQIAERLAVPLTEVKRRMFTGLRQLADLLRASTPR